MKSSSLSFVATSNIFSSSSFKYWAQDCCFFHGELTSHHHEREIKYYYSHVVGGKSVMVCVVCLGTNFTQASQIRLLYWLSLAIGVEGQTDMWSVLDPITTAQLLYRTILLYHSLPIAQYIKIVISGYKAMEVVGVLFEI